LQRVEVQMHREADGALWNGTAWYIDDVLVTVCK